MKASLRGHLSILLGLVMTVSVIVGAVVGERLSHTSSDPNIVHRVDCDIKSIDDTLEELTKKMSALAIIIDIMDVNVSDRLDRIDDQLMKNNSEGELDTFKGL